jgi:predicted kinase
LAGEALDRVREPVEQALWDLATQVLMLGADVILEYGFWSRSEREAFRERAAQLGARSELHLTDASQDELVRRLARRNADPPPGTFRIDEARLREWMMIFEPPEEDELRSR